VLNLDLSKALPRPTLSPLISLLPGVFFEISILAGNPQLSNCLIEKTLYYIPLKPYVQLAIALFAAFIIGIAAILLVGLIQLAFYYVHVARLILEEELARWPGIPLLQWAGRSNFIRARPQYYRLWTATALRAQGDGNRARYIYRAWDKLAHKLLKERYGIDTDDLEEEWEHLFWSVGMLTDVEWRGPLLLIALEATAWCGVAAITLAPALRNKYYLAICLIFFLQGLMNDYYSAKRRADPVASAIGRIRALLREYEKDAQRQAHQNVPSEEAGAL
jgi:hypothetical protein